MTDETVFPIERTTARGDSPLRRKAHRLAKAGAVPHWLANRVMEPVPIADDRPIRRFWRRGVEALTSAELLTIILGTEPAVARDVLRAAEGSLRKLAARPASELTAIPGLGETKAARVLAALELGNRLAQELRPAVTRIRSPSDVVTLLAPRLRDLTVEEFHILALDTQSNVLRAIMITRGILNSSLVHPREVFKAAVAESAAGLILVHNHPSGDPTPSAEDRNVTSQLVAAGRLLDMPVYDHVIIAGDRWLSMASSGLL